MSILLLSEFQLNLDVTQLSRSAFHFFGVVMTQFHLNRIFYQKWYAGV
ncbi:MAG: hypothetical protein ACRD7E_22385 [Bryobacteraceae bacterium]